MIRVATIGTSMITGWFAAAAQQVPGIELACAYSRDANRAARLAAEWGMSWSSSDLAEVLSSPKIDAIYIASPNSVHGGQAAAALAAGKHVLVEKPATPTADEFADLVALARRQGVVLLEAIRNVYDPGWRAARELLPRLGVIRRVSLRKCQRSSRYDQVLAGERVNIFDPELAGGALADIGVYCVQPLVDLFGEPQRVLAASVPVLTGADGAGAALAVYPGFVADVSYSKITVSSTPSEIQGELGTLVIDRLTAPRRLRLEFLDGTTEEIGFDDTENNLRFEIERFVAGVHGADITADQERSLASLRVMDAIRAAS